MPQRALIASLLLLADAPLLAQGPVLEVSPRKLEFGHVDQGERRTGIVTVANRGDRPLVIAKLTVTCGCFEVSIGSRRIAPGASTELRVLLDSNRITGKVAKYVILETNAPADRTLMIPATGHVEAVWRIDTRTLAFGDVERDAAPTRSFKILVRAGTKLDLTGVRDRTGQLGITSQPFGRTDEEHGWVVAVTLPVEKRLGRFLSLLTVSTDAALVGEQTLSVTADVLGPVRLEPRRLSFGRVAAGGEKTLTVRVFRADGRPLAVREVVSRRAEVTATVEPGATAGESLIRVTFRPAPGPRKRVGGRLVIRTDAGGQPRVTLPYSGTAAGDS